jgi:hypothetical protein
LATSVLPTPVGPEKQEGADRLVRLAQARARHLDRRGQRVDRLVLAEDHALQVAVEVLQLARSSSETRSWRDARDLGDDRPRPRPCVMVFLRLASGSMRCAAPASSITSIALSGRWRSLM